MTNVLAGILLAGVIIIGVMVMAEKVEDSRTQRIRAEVALVNANASAREARMALAIISLAGTGGLGLIIVAIIAVTWNRDAAPKSNNRRQIVHHHHTEKTHTIERQVVVFLNEGSKRDFYKALSDGGRVKYIDG